MFERKRYNKLHQITHQIAAKQVLLEFLNYIQALYTTAIISEFIVYILFNNMIAHQYRIAK